MQFFELYRKKYNDLIVAVENFDISLSKELKSLNIRNSEGIIRFQVRKFESTFAITVEQMKLYLQKSHIAIPASNASIIKSFYYYAELPISLYEKLIEMNIFCKKINSASAKEFVINHYIEKFEDYYTSLLLLLKYFDYDDAALFNSAQKKNRTEYFELI